MVAMSLPERPLDFIPEPVEVMAKRTSAALEDVYSKRLIEAGVQKRPGRFRKHIFDFIDGTRLIISRDVFVDGEEPKLHISISYESAICPALELLNKAVMGLPTKDEGEIAKRAAYGTMRMLAAKLRKLGLEKKLLFIGVSDKGVMHFVEPTPDQLKSITQSKTVESLPDELAGDSEVL